MMMMQASNVPLNLVQCRYCNRNFSADRIGKHENVCIGTKQARAAFDTRAQRLADFAGELMPARGFGGGGRRVGATNQSALSKSKYAPPKMSSSSYSSSGPSSYAPKRDWRREHEEFQAAIRAAKTDTRNTYPSSSSRQQQQSRSSYGGATRTMGNSRTGGGGYPGMSGMSGGGGGGAMMRTTTTSSSSSRMPISQQISSSGGGAPRGAGFVGRQPAPRTTSSRGGVNSSGLTGASRYGGSSSSSGTGFRDMSSGAGIGAKQVSILPTNDTSAGMWAAMGRDAPTYGSYGPIGSRGPRRAGGGANLSSGGGSTGFW